MSEDDRSAEIEDIAEDAVNELLGMYGYDGVGKNELKASLKKRGFTMPSSTNPAAFHPYLHALPINHRFVLAAAAASTSAGVSKTPSAGVSKPISASPSKGVKAKVPTVARIHPPSVQTPPSASNACQWCKKEKAQIVETLLPPASSSSPHAIKLRFCSPACLNAYKLDIIRRETEACLREITAPSLEPSEPVSTAIAAVEPTKSTVEKIESPSPTKSTPPKARGGSNKESSSRSSAGADLWTSAVGNGGKKAQGRHNAAISPKSAQRSAPDHHHHDTESSDGGPKLQLLDSTAGATNKHRSKRRSAPPRPHPYYALNKKYWMTVRGGSNDESREDTAVNREKADESSSGDAMDEILFFSTSCSNGGSPITVEHLPEALPVETSSDHGSPQSSSPHSDITTIKIHDHPQPPPPADVKPPETVPSTVGSVAPTLTATVAAGPPTLASLFSTMPLNVMWIPVPVPIPVPIPIPIPVNMPSGQRSMDTKKMTECPPD